MTDLEQARNQKLEALHTAVKLWRKVSAGRDAVEAEQHIERALRDLIEHDAPPEAA